MFYLLPPKGYSTFSCVENDIHIRFQFIQKIVELKGDIEKIQEYLRNNPSFCANLDCLIEGSKRDCVSHFIFRLACLRSGQLQDYWIKAEKELFLFRLKSIGDLEDVINVFLKNIKKSLSSLKLFQCHRLFLKEIWFLLNSIKNKKDGMFSCNERTTCSHQISVPWRFVQDLVSNRQIHLWKGVAKVPCFYIYDLFVSLYEIILQNGIEQLRGFGVRFSEDERLLKIRKNIFYYFTKLLKSPRSIKSLRHQDIEREAKNFPLCMQQLHLRLKETRRLPHYERFRYTLFLKDIGVSLHENIQFWKRYYSETPKCCQSGCQHIWTGSTGKRFEYGIRHLYGEEGRKISYSSHSCSSLQALRPQPQDCGGCPFQHLDNSTLSNLVLKNQKITQIQLEAILKAVNNSNPSLACELYLSACRHKHIYRHRQLLRFSSHLSANNNHRKSLTRKSYSFAQCHKSFEASKESSCLTCKSSVIVSDVSFLSPSVYYQLGTYTSNDNKNQIKEKFS